MLVGAGPAGSKILMGCMEGHGGIGREGGPYQHCRWGDKDEVGKVPNIWAEIRYIVGEERLESHTRNCNVTHRHLHDPPTVPHIEVPHAALRPK